MPVKMEAPYGLGANIRNLRQQKKMTQLFLAELVGITPQHLCDIENSNVNVSSTLLKNFADALETTTDALLGREPPRGSLEAEIPHHIELYQKIIRILKRQDQGEERFQTARLLQLIQELEETVDFLLRYQNDKRKK